MIFPPWNFVPSWFRDRNTGSKQQVGLLSNPAASSNLPQSETGPQHVSCTQDALPLVGATVDSGDSKRHSAEADERMENHGVAKDVALGGTRPLGDAAETAEPVPLRNIEVVRGAGEHHSLIAQVSPSDIDPAPHSDARESTGRSLALRSLWNQLNSTFGSLTGGLITATDLRREVIRQRGIALREAESILASAGGDDLRPLRDILLGLLRVETQLQEKDENLIQQCSLIRSQGFKIFGPAAESSFKVLEDQGVIVQSEGSDTEESVLSTDDIRLDQTSEARRYLSKKGDVDLLRETLMDLDVEQMMMSEAGERPNILEDLKSRRNEVLLELGRAEEELARLHDELPERKVSISEEYLRLPSELEHPVAGQSDIEGGKLGDSKLGSQFQSDVQGHGLSQILEGATKDNPVRSKTLVNAYLLYQLQRSPQEQQNFLKTVEETSRKSDKALETDPSNPPLDIWFEEETSKKSRRKNMSSEGFSRGTNADTTANIQKSHGQSEPHKRRRAPDDEYTRPRSMFAASKDNVAAWVDAKH
ncbi:uncharacterized protein Z519_10861 [Cladophialophora bantiana CBS 173.52]|uniref:Uncharacterized protein n=1 Tax=Cladophialophora bantiana (strain ATCC 10958 / CBS 173.52 / CDC B-1940 / NIH 8579) TaxID=1442370 RepID=A0A0D2HUS9_CLAB1|nr:uncharacterized protein Z519_10861 [Cladophialophora bantiana CBS 173.52]KIW88294.1 hypothetical protein Z519_10861 [Cladophialophora bantiana CBS 173.52]